MRSPEPSSIGMLEKYDLFGVCFELMLLIKDFRSPDLEDLNLSGLRTSDVSSPYIIL